MRVNPETDKVVFVEIFVSHPLRIQSCLNKSKSEINLSISGKPKLTDIYNNLTNKSRN